MERLNSTPWRLVAAAAALGLAGCQSVTQGYDGSSLSRSEVARVIGEGDPDLIEVLAASGASTSAPGMPRVIYIVAVDGEDIAESDVVEVLPGRRVLSIYGREVRLSPEDIASNIVSLEFQAEAGHTYWIRPKLSEHQRPWSYNLYCVNTRDVVATSEPMLEDLALVALPPEARDWDVHSWSETLHYAHATYAAPAGANGEPLEFLQRERKTVPLDVTFADLRDRRVSERRRVGFDADDMDLQGGRWMEQWRSLQPDENGLYEFGGGAYRPERGKFYSTVYVVQSESPQDAVVEQRLAAWQARLLKEYGKRVQWL